MIVSNFINHLVLICCYILICHCFTTVSSLASTNYPKTIVIEVNGDCQTVGKRVAHLHGYRVIKEIFPSFCEVEEDLLSEYHARHKRAVLNGEDPVDILQRHKDVSWAEHQVPKSRRKREYVLNDPQWTKMWYLKRNKQSISLPDLNVTGAWLMGYTGRGSVVSFLDDGLEFDHPDLYANYDKDASYDINDNDSDPTPRYDPSNENKHGTRCAGEVAAMINNSICGVGVAYHSKVGGIRMLDGDVTDSVEARSLSHRPDHVDIYSASWGPDDNGLVVDGPGRLAKKAFEDGVRKGRNGKGSIFIWASGNGGRQFDSCACDGYINSIYTIAISATTERGEKPWYLEACSATLASAYSSGNMNGAENDIITTDLRHECTERHTGTSAAAPLAAAIIALMLEANPNLTWRDVMHIVILSARPSAIPSNTDYIKNAAGFNISSKFGFGLMDAGLMTWYAEKWINVPPMVSCSSAQIESNLFLGPSQTKFSELNLMNCKSSDPTQEANYIEQVQIFVSLSADRRGDIELYLYSPSGTKSQLLPRRQKDASNKGFQDWAFLTVQLWGESPHGLWKIEAVNVGPGSARLQSWRLVVHGTKDYPWSTRSASPSKSSDSKFHSCHPECKPDLQPCGPSEIDCLDCRHFKKILENGKFQCLSVCPDGTYLASNTTCLPCHANCAACSNLSDTSCINCKSDNYLVHDTMACVQMCPSAYYTDRKLRKCVQCKSNCLTCDNEPSQCTSCNVGYALKGEQCVKTPKICASTEYYDFKDNTCQSCDSRCLTCSGSRSDQCTSCNQTENSEYPMVQQHSCVKTCSPGYFPSSNSCILCYDTCASCTSADENTCTECKLGYIFENDKCQKYTGKPFYIDPKTHKSHLCHSSCLFCNGSKPNQCIACDTIKLLSIDGYCVDDCPTGYYSEQYSTASYTTSICKRCPLGCLNCIDNSNCNQCDWNYVMKNDDRCYPMCKAGQYLSGTDCQVCQSPCHECSNKTYCLSCQNYLFLLNGTCVQECPDNYYSDGSKCELCHPICDSCTGPSELDCKTCTIGFSMINKKCNSNCLNEAYYDKVDNICKLCSENCLQCLHPGTYCRDCVYPMALDMLTHRCLSCCLTNKTDENCCQCSQSHDGFCLHPLVKPETSKDSTSWLAKIQNKFRTLDRKRQTILLICLCISTFISASCVISLVCYAQVNRSRLKRLRQLSSNVQYKILNSNDDIDEGEDELYESSSFLSNVSITTTNNGT